MAEGWGSEAGTPTTYTQLDPTGSGLSRTFTSFSYEQPATPGPTPSAALPVSVTQSTSGATIAEAQNATYGQIIPLWVGGAPRLGGHIIYGPNIHNDGTNVTASFGVSFGFPANPDGTRALWEIRFDGVKVWDKDVSGNFIGPSFTYRFYPGSETQAADPIVIADYPAAPIAFRGQCLLFFENLDLARFNGTVPFVTARIADSSFGNPLDGISAGDALQTVAYSPYIGLTADDFECVGLTARWDAYIDAQGTSWLQELQNFCRIYNWKLVQNDKLRVIEPSSFEPVITLDETWLIADDNGSYATQVTAAPQAVRRELEVDYIDIDVDYQYVPQVARRPREPIAVTASVGKDSVTLPIVSTAQDMAAAVTLRKYQDELSRQMISATGLPYAAGIECGDVVRIKAPYRWIIGTVETLLLGANLTPKISVMPILRCLFANQDANAVFFAVGLTNSYSSSDGLNWTSIAAPAHGAAVAAYVGTDLVAIAGNPPYAQISNDLGGSWSSAAMSAPADNPTAHGLIWDGTRYVVIGAWITLSDPFPSGAIVWESTDGVTWSGAAPAAFDNYSLFGIATDGSGLYVAIGRWSEVSGSTPTFTVAFTSTDLSTWSRQDITADGHQIDPTSIVWTGTRFVAVGQDIGIGIGVIVSADGVSWTRVASGILGRLESVCFSGSRLVAVGSDSGSGPLIVTSADDGDTWSVCALPHATGGYSSITQNSGVWVAIGTHSTDCIIARSTDGVNWAGTTITGGAGPTCVVAKP